MSHTQNAPAAFSHTGCILRGERWERLEWAANTLASMRERGSLTVLCESCTTFVSFLRPITFQVELVQYKYEFPSCVKWRDTVDGETKGMACGDLTRGSLPPVAVLLPKQKDGSRGDLIPVVRSSLFLSNISILDQCLQLKPDTALGRQAKFCPPNF